MTDYAAAVAEARNLNTCPDRLREFYRNHRQYSEGIGKRTHYLFSLVAAHPNTPPDILHIMASKQSEAFLTNPILPLLPLERPDFGDHFSTHTLLKILRHKNVPPFLLRQREGRASRYLHSHLRWHIQVCDAVDIQQTDWDAEILKLLRMGRKTFESTMQETLTAGQRHRRFHHVHWGRRLAVALNAETTKSQLRRLTHDGNCWVRAAATVRLNYPERPVCGLTFTTI
jgi:hypothetical protein